MAASLLAAYGPPTAAALLRLQRAAAPGIALSRGAVRAIHDSLTDVLESALFASAEAVAREHRGVIEVNDVLVALRSVLLSAAPVLADAVSCAAAATAARAASLPPPRNPSFDTRLAVGTQVSVSWLHFFACGRVARGTLSDALVRTLGPRGPRALSGCAYGAVAALAGAADALATHLLAASTRATRAAGARWVSLAAVREGLAAHMELAALFQSMGARVVGCDVGGGNLSAIEDEPSEAAVAAPGALSEEAEAAADALDMLDVHAANDDRLSQLIAALPAFEEKTRAVDCPLTTPIDRGFGLAWGGSPTAELTQWPLALASDLSAELLAFATSPPLPFVGATLAHTIECAGGVVGECVPQRWGGDLDTPPAPGLGCVPPVVPSASAHARTAAAAVSLADAAASDSNRAAARTVAAALERVSQSLSLYQSFLTPHQAPNEDECKHESAVHVLPPPLALAWAAAVDAAERVLDCGGALAGAAPFEWRGTPGVYSVAGRVGSITTQFAIPHPTFARLVADISRVYKTDLRWSSDALAILQAAAEDDVIVAFRDAAHAMHAAGVADEDM